MGGGLFRTNKLEWKDNGRPVTEEEFDNIVSEGRGATLRSHAGVPIVSGRATAKNPAGRDTLKRAIIFKSALSEQADVVLAGFGGGFAELVRINTGGRVTEERLRSLAKDANEEILTRVIVNWIQRFTTNLVPAGKVCNRLRTKLRK